MTASNIYLSLWIIHGYFAKVEMKYDNKSTIHKGTEKLQSIEYVFEFLDASNIVSKMRYWRNLLGFVNFVCRPYI